MARERKTLSVTYKRGVRIREDLEHLVNANTMARTPEMLASGFIETADGERLVYHDVRMYFPAAPRG